MSLAGRGSFKNHTTIRHQRDHTVANRTLQQVADRKKKHLNCRHDRQMARLHVIEHTFAGSRLTMAGLKPPGKRVSGAIRLPIATRGVSSLCVISACTAADTSSTPPKPGSFCTAGRTATSSVCNFGIHDQLTCVHCACVLQKAVTGITSLWP